MRISLLIGLVFFLSFSSAAKSSSFEENIFMTQKSHLRSQRSFLTAHFMENSFFKHRPIPLFRLFREKQKRNRKVTASVLAFPFPFGIVGLHRIYLGCPPYVPVVYIASLGGVFGALPLIDFFVILIDKNTENYVNNPQVFMWIK